MASVPFNNLITFSRGSNATLVDSTGKIAYAPNNLLTFSEQFDNAAWSKGDTTVSANAIAAPDGTTTADLLTEGSAGTAVTSQTVSNSGPTIANSIYIKAGTATWVRFRLTSGANALSVWLNIATGALGTNSVSGTAVFVSATVTALASGWYQITFVGTIPAVTLYSFTVNSATADGSSTRTNAATYYLWGAQLELGSAATTYNSTTVKNLLGFSEAFDNAAWTKSNASIVTGAQANPVNGAFNAQKLMEDTVATVPHGFASANVTTIIGTPMTSAFYAKAAGRSWIVANAFNAANKRCWFDLANGTTGTTAAGCTTSITSVGNGWYRCAVIQTAAATTMSLGLYASTADGTLSYTGDGNSGVYIYGAQLSDSASLDPYVPTPAAAPSSTAYYGPRFDYDPVTLQPKGLLVEEARTNLLIYSEEFDNAAWVKTRSTVTANQAVAPNGSNVADLFVEDTSTGGHEIYKTAVTTAAAHTFSMYAKLASGTRNLTLFPQGTNVGWAIFNLSTGAVTATGGAAFLSSSITAVGNGWYRCSVTWTALATTTFCACYTTNSPTTPAPSYTGDGTSGFYLYGAQLEAGAFATSYIPTVASTVTRSADVATINGSLFSQWYGQTEGTLLANFVPTNSIASNTRGATITDGTNRVTDIYIDVSVWRSFNGTTNVTPAGSTAVLNSTVNFASAYKSGDYAASMNGGAVGTAATAGVQSANKLTIGTNITNSAGFLNGHIRSIDYIPARAADFQLQVLTT